VSLLDPEIDVAARFARPATIEIGDGLREETSSQPAWLNVGTPATVTPVFLPRRWRA
jgi:hypothetical protein